MGSGGVGIVVDLGEGRSFGIGRNGLGFGDRGSSIGSPSCRSDVGVVISI
jgi:hypothetical protein